MRRVAVTGIGVICACGLNRSEFWTVLCEGRSAIGPIQAVEPGRLRFENGAEVRGFDPARHFDHSRLSLLDRFAQFTLLAAREAVQDSGIELNQRLQERTAVVTGSSMGGQSTQETGYASLYRDNGRVHPLTVPRTMANAGASHISMEFGLTGPAYTISTACASSTHAIGQAFRMVRSGEVELAIAGGGEAPFTLGHLMAWDGMRVIARDTCRPFSLERQGMILGEGAAMLVLEPLEAARARGAVIHAEIAGFGMSADAHHVTQPSVTGAAKAMRAALCDAQIQPHQIAYINAHGTGTSSNDRTECQAVREVFAEHATRLALSSTKSMHGHALGAAGAIEAAATALALRHGLLPPTANFVTADPECGLDVIPNQTRRATAEYALSN
jgi:nodulation protein E